VKGQREASAALADFALGLEHVLESLLDLPDEAGIDPRWARALVELRSFSLRPAKRVRPTLVVVGWALAAQPAGSGSGLCVDPAVGQFAAGLEFLHTFMLVHDDVADHALTRRQGPSLHQALGGGRAGNDLAVVLGDHLYARAFEVMLGSGLPNAAQAVSYLLAVCRHTAAGQYLDLELSRASLDEVTLFQTLKVAHLKTAKYGFIAPLVVGGMLGGAAPALLEPLERIGRQVGLAFQLRDDLLGLFGDDRVAGKAGGGDFLEGKRTFPVIAAWTRADLAGRDELERLFRHENPGQAQLQAVRALIERWGGKQATERVIDRMTRGARRTLSQLPHGRGAKSVLDQLVARLATRVS
jgi:geranylgeranyl diphosphate synthase type I